MLSGGNVLSSRVPTSRKPVACRKTLVSSGIPVAELICVSMPVVRRYIRLVSCKLATRYVRSEYSYLKSPDMPPERCNGENNLMDSLLSIA